MYLKYNYIKIIIYKFKEYRWINDILYFIFSSSLKKTKKFLFKPIEKPN